MADRPAERDASELPQKLRDGVLDLLASLAEPATQGETAAPEREPEPVPTRYRIMALAWVPLHTTDAKER